MSSLFGTLSIALRSLLAQQGALDVTGNNIANVNTRGYARQRPILNETPPVRIGSLVLGTGVSLDKVEGIRDRILELRIHQETQRDGELDAFLRAMHQVEAAFNEAKDVGLGNLLDNFFNNLLQLSTDPSSLPLRQGVLAAAGDLANGFNRRAESLAGLQSSLNLEVTQAVNDINTLTVEIADLNRRVSGLEAIGKDALAFEDRRTNLIRDLSKLVDIAVIDAGGGSLTITTSNGTALVVGDTHVELQTQIVAGFQNIFAQGADITATITSGQLGGQLEVRDQTIPSILADLDSLAADLANSVNAVHTAGFDLFGAAGGDFFVPPPGGGVGAAGVLAVALTDPALVAASLDGQPGDNANLLALIDLRDQGIIGGQRPTEFYSGLIFRIGDDIANASADSEAQSLVLRQLANQRSSISGVSLDEEAVNLIRFQRAFEASARVVSVVDELTQTVINMAR